MSQPFSPLRRVSTRALPLHSLFLLLLLQITGLTPVQAQHTDLPVFCGQDAFNHIVRQQYPELYQSFQNTFEDNRNRPPAVSGRSPLTIRVVVHVVWKNPEENLADSIIYNQLAVLNEDYNRENADTANLRAIFQPAAGNPQIRFELAGIVRVQTTSTFKLDLTANEIMVNLKTASQGGSDAWDPSAYLNLWVCKIQPIQFGGITVGQILGFAFPPNNLGHWPANSGAPAPGQDGVVIDYRVIGRNNPATVPVPGGTGNLVVRGRTATHEIGHYLGLRHIWGDGGLLGLPNNCNESDGVDDTPFANAQSPFNCDTARNTCNKVEPFYGMDMPDLVENYMDYATESCMNMFTRGQADLMRGVLTSVRNGLLQASASPETAAPGARPRLFPNPTRSGATLQLPATWPDDAVVDLTGADGRVLVTWAAALSGAGERQLEIDTRGLAPGWYALRVRADGQVWTERLVVLP